MLLQTNSSIFMETSLNMPLQAATRQNTYYFVLLLGDDLFMMILYACLKYVYIFTDAYCTI